MNSRFTATGRMESEDVCFCTEVFPSDEPRVDMVENVCVSDRVLNIDRVLIFRFVCVVYVV